MGALGCKMLFNTPFSILTRHGWISACYRDLNLFSVAASTFSKSLDFQSRVAHDNPALPRENPGAACCKSAFATIAAKIVIWKRWKALNRQCNLSKRKLNGKCSFLCACRIFRKTMCLQGRRPACNITDHMPNKTCPIEEVFVGGVISRSSCSSLPRQRHFHLGFLHGCC